MVTKLVKEAGDTVTDATLNAFLALTTREAQLVYVADLLQQAQKTYNGTTPPPATLVNKVAVVPQTAGLAVQAALPLAAGAASQALYNAVTDLGIGAVKLAAAGGDTITNAALTAFLALGSLEAQLVYLAAGIQDAEATYNAANPTTPVNAITLAPNYDARQVGVTAIMPLSNGGLASLAGALPY